jgi:hypothetical protein
VDLDRAHFFPFIIIDKEATLEMLAQFIEFDDSSNETYFK